MLPAEREASQGRTPVGATLASVMQNVSSEDIRWPKRWALTGRRLVSSCFSEIYGLSPRGAIACLRFETNPCRGHELRRFSSSHTWCFGRGSQQMTAIIRNGCR